MSYVKRNYTNPKLSGAYSGLQGFVKNRKIKNKEEAATKLQELDSYTLHKDIQYKFKRRRIMANYINHIWASDLKEITKFKGSNNNNSYILVVVDGFSKKAYTEFLKKKDSTSMIQAFGKILKKARAAPDLLYVDQGKEYISKPFENFLTSHGIKRYHTFSKIKSSFAERFIRTIFTKISRYMTEKKTKRFIDVMDDFVNSYNNTFHRTIQTTPNSVTKENEMEIFHVIYKDLMNPQKPQVPKFSVGDWVRISRAKLIFEKGIYKLFIYSILLILTSFINCPLCLQVMTKTGVKNYL